MTINDDTTPPGPDDQRIRDLADFHLRWFEFRASALHASSSAALDAQEREILIWLIRMADRIGARDLAG